MASGKRALSLVTVGSILVLSFFFIGTGSAVLLYGGSYSPVYNWISDLGDPGKNPAGYLWFNTGCILTGLSLVLVVFGLREYKHPVTHRFPGGMAAQVTGYIAGIAVTCVGIFPENYGVLHVVSAGLFFCLLGLFVLLVTFDNRSRLKFGNGLKGYAILVGMLDLLFILTIAVRMHVPVLEWMAVISGLVWIGCLGYIAGTTVR